MEARACLKLERVLRYSYIHVSLLHSFAIQFVWFLYVHYFLYIKAPNFGARLRQIRGRGLEAELQAPKGAKLKQVLAHTSDDGLDLPHLMLVAERMAEAHIISLRRHLGIQLLEPMMLRPRRKPQRGCTDAPKGQRLVDDEELVRQPLHLAGLRLTQVARTCLQMLAPVSQSSAGGVNQQQSSCT